MRDADLDPTPQPRTVVAHHDTDTSEVKNLIQWGPVVAGVATTIAIMVVLTVLGLAIGAAAFDPRDGGDNVGTWAGIWGALSAIIAFFVGGHVAAYSASVPGKASALLNGFMVGAAVLVLVLYLTGSGIGNLFGTVGNNLGDIANVVQDQAQQQGVTADDAVAEAEQAIDDADATMLDDAFNTVRDAAWGTLGGLLLALGAATAGGLVGSNSRRELLDRSVT